MFKVRMSDMIGINILSNYFSNIAMYQETLHVISRLFFFFLTCDEPLSNPV